MVCRRLPGNGASRSYSASWRGYSGSTHAGQRDSVIGAVVGAPGDVGVRRGVVTDSGVADVAEGSWGARLFFRECCHVCHLTHDHLVVRESELASLAVLDCVVDKPVGAQHDAAPGYLPAGACLEGDAIVGHGHVLDVGAVRIGKPLGEAVLEVGQCLLAELAAVRTTGPSGKHRPVAIVIDLQLIEYLRLRDHRVQRRESSEIAERNSASSETTHVCCTRPCCSRIDMQRRCVSS